MTRRVVAAALAILVVLLSGCGGPRPQTVTIYTSVDRPVAEPILRAFEASSGIAVLPVYDIEAAKTTGLVSRIVAEASRPNADVFWSSEFAQTIGLQQRGLLDPYDPPSAADVPARLRDPGGHWTGFAARMRVILVNTRLVAPEHYPRSIFDLLDPYWRGDLAIAVPLFGTAATHAAALFAVLGDANAQRFFLGLQGNGARFVDGNSVVRDMVASGEVKVGLTDSDDANEAVTNGRPVRMIVPDQGADPGALGTLVIPNAVALVRGAPHPAAARRLIDHLVSPEVEARLAASGSLQMPVRPGVAAPPDVPRLGQVKAMDVTAQAVAEKMPTASAWLRETLVR